jgi:hypothetical protein
MIGRQITKLSATIFLFSYILIPSRAFAGLYAGLGFDLGFAVQGDTASGEVAIFFGDKFTLGMEARLGYDHIFYFPKRPNGPGLYIAGEAYTRIMFDISGSRSFMLQIDKRSADMPYISGGANFKLGVGLNKGKTKLYAMASAEYIAGNIGMGGYTGSPDSLPEEVILKQLGMVLVGFGVGVKQEVLPFMDLFLEAKMMMDVFTTHVTETYPIGNFVVEKTGFSGYQLLTVATGVDFKF